MFCRSTFVFALTVFQINIALQVFVILLFCLQELVYMNHSIEKSVLIVKGSLTKHGIGIKYVKFNFKSSDDINLSIFCTTEIVKQANLP